VLVLVKRRFSGKSLVYFLFVEFFGLLLSDNIGNKFNN
jgi:hypothetical protein